MAEKDPSQKDKVTLDKSELDIDRAKDKVELDLDDAPFLEEEEEFQEPSHQEPLEEDTESLSVSEEQPREPGWKNRKNLTIAGIVLLILVALAVVLLFISSGKPPPPPSGEQHDQVIRDDVPGPEPPEEIFEEVVNLKPFMVELREGENIQFLFARFSLPAKSEQMAGEIRDKTIIIRDAVYYYLRNKETIFLKDKDNSDAIKKDLLSVINQYLGTGRLEDILIEEYLVK
ncbi:flagellar basal body-associated FliL family protein [Desulfonatronovibrio hydrogenovorans]|uniref:flagellar basal body-associated FliL family protein n=1 Tax=Desulfonatronovibrio hydrogenovorans TaxID=53245 RepID=UPI00048F6E44|nr:flagellar basal body-associated FliL family protein [Desulfonatronovibrio hydrogenovorans]